MMLPTWWYELLLLPLHIYPLPADFKFIRYLNSTIQKTEPKQDYLVVLNNTLVNVSFEQYWIIMIKYM